MTDKPSPLDDLLNSKSLESVTMTRKQLNEFRDQAVAEALAGRATGEKAGGLVSPEIIPPHDEGERPLIAQRFRLLCEKMALPMIAQFDDAHIYGVMFSALGSMRRRVEEMNAIAAGWNAQGDRQPAADAGGLSDTVQLVLAEVEKATRKFPTWPTDPLHAVAVLGEEFGELTKAVLQTTYEPHKVKEGELRMEAIQTAAMSLRFLASLERYEFTQGAQHSQGDDRPPANGAAGQKGGA